MLGVKPDACVERTAAQDDQYEQMILTGDYPAVNLIVKQYDHHCAIDKAKFGL